MSKKAVYVEDAVEALKELTVKEEFYVDPAESMFKMFEDLPPTRCSDCIANGGDFECDRVHCRKGAQPSTKMSDSWRDELVTKGLAADAARDVYKRNTTAAISAMMAIKELPSSEYKAVVQVDGYADGFADGYKQCQMDSPLLTEEDYTELHDRFGAEVEFVVRDMMNKEVERWEPIKI